MSITLIPRICEICNKEFSARPIDIKRGGGRFCSIKCLGIHRRSAVEKHCEVCGKSFRAIPYHIKRGTGRFCSHKCYHKSLVTQTERICQTCGKVFMTFQCKVTEHTGLYCSKACQHEGMKGDKNPVWRGGHTHYRGANWNEQRDAARKRDGNICQSCHRKQRRGEKAFHIHHIIPFRFFNGDFQSANDLSNLITLCPTCHKKAEFGVISIPKPLL